MEMNQIAPGKGARSSKRRLGRGFTRGKTCGRGHKGQHSRSGSSIPAGFEGGQNPFHLRIPKFGFTSQVSLTHQELNVMVLDKYHGLLDKANLSEEARDAFKSCVSLDGLKASGLIRKSTKSVKIFGNHEIKGAFVLKGIRISKGALASVEKNGGSAS